MRTLFQSISLWMRNHRILWEVRILLLIFCFSLVSPLISNNKPLRCTYDGETYYPAFADLIQTSDRYRLGKTITTPLTNWNTFEFESATWTFFQYSANQQQRADRKLAPFEKNKTGSIHFLGTDERGRDVWARIFAGLAYSLMIGLCTMLIASLLGAIIGGVSGYFENELEVGRFRKWGVLLGLFPAYYYGWHLRRFVLQDALANANGWWGQLMLSLLLSFVFLLLFYLLGKWIDQKTGNQTVRWSIDRHFSMGTVLMSATPTILIVVLVSTITEVRSTGLLIFTLGITGWAGIARLVRGEVIRWKQEAFVEAGKTLGLSDLRLLIHHVLPNLLPALMVTIVFGIAGIILLESGLSFLGLGVPEDTATLGSVLRSGKENLDAWWLILFPGIAIFGLVVLLQRIADKIAKQKVR